MQVSFLQPPTGLFRSFPAKPSACSLLSPSACHQLLCLFVTVLTRRDGAAACGNRHLVVQKSGELSLGEGFLRGNSHLCSQGISRGWEIDSLRVYCYRSVFLEVSFL